MRVVGAAVLPFCIDPVCGRLYFWLGKERYNAKWAQGSEQWSCFGGKSQCKDEPAERIAAREFVEETAGMLPYFSSDALPRTGFFDIEESLRESNYLFRLVFYSQKQPRVTPPTSTTGCGGPVAPPVAPQPVDEHDPLSWAAAGGDTTVHASAAGGELGGSSGNGNNYRASVYVLYVKQLDWDPSAARRFRACFKLMQTLPCTIRDPVRLEWLLQHPAIHIRRTPTTCHSTLTGSTPAVPLTTPLAPPLATPSSPVATPLATGASDSSPAPFHQLVGGALPTPDACGEPGTAGTGGPPGANTLAPLAEHVSIEKYPCSPPCRAMCAAQCASLSAGVSARVRELLVGMVSAPEDGDVGSSSTGGKVAAAKEEAPLPSGAYKLIVNKDFFEKQDIALWSVPQLQRACRSNGVLTTRNGRVERCRTSFIKQMCAVMSELAFHAPSMLDESW